MAISEVGSTLGTTAARTVKWGEQALGVIGWFGVCIIVAAIVSATAHRGLPMAQVEGDLAALAPWAAMLGSSIYLRKPSRWITELGFPLGYRFTLMFGLSALFAWLFVTDADASAGMGNVSIISMQMSAALCAFSAWLHWDQVEEALHRFRRFLNGANGNAERSALACAFEPLWWTGCSLFASAAALSPRPFMNAVCAPFGAAFAKHTTNDGHTPTLLAMPPALATHSFWIAVATLCALRLYIAFRRVGQGMPERGFHLWLYSLGEVFGALILAASIFVQLQPVDLNRRLLICVLAFMAAGFAWFCDRSRRRILGR